MSLRHPRTLLLLSSVAAALLMAAPIALALPLPDQLTDFSAAEQSRLKQGQVVLRAVEAAEKTTKDYHQVVASRWIKASPAKVWELLLDQSTLLNGAPGFRQVKTLKKASGGLHQQVLYKVVLGGVFPFQYTTSVNFVPQSRVSFQRESGSFKDFRGECRLIPVASGKETVLVYHVGVIPDMPLPKMVTQAFLKKDVPNTLRHIAKKAEG